MWPDVDTACDRVVRVTAEVAPGEGQAVLAQPRESSSIAMT